MSFVNNLSSSGAVTESLYKVVCPMIASKNCIKCISDDGDLVYTTDVTCLLSHLDIEHPVGEVLLQSLEAHKESNGTGSKTLLFMITHISKAVSQLQNLGIPIRESLSLINTYISKLIQDVENIAIPVSTVADKRISEDFTGQSTAFNVSRTTNKKQVLSESNSKHFNGFVVHKGSENNYCNSTKILHGEQSSDCLNVEFPENGRAKTDLTIDCTYDDPSSDLLETDPVLLKMMPAKQYVAEDDILWYFSNNSNPKTELSHKAHTNSETNMLSQILLSPSEDTNSTMQQPLKENSDDLLHSFCESFDDLQEFTSSKSSLEEKEKEKESNLHYLSKNILVEEKQEHDSDFEDCFDEEDNKKHFSVTVESKPYMSCHQNQQHNQECMLLHNASKHFSPNRDFDFDSKTYSYVADDNESEDEFSACFTDMDFKDENYQIKKKNLTPLTNRKNGLDETINKNVNCSRQDNKSNNILPKCVSAPIAASRSSIAKLNDMLDLVERFKARTLNINDDNSVINGQEIDASSKGNQCASEAVNILSSSSSSTISNLKEKSQCGQQMQMLQENHVLTKKLLDKPKDLNMKRSHNITVSSRHLSDTEVNQPSVSGLDCKSKTCLSPSQNGAFENLRLNRVDINFQETKTEEDILLKGFCISHMISANSYEEPAIDISSCQSQRIILPQDTRLLVETDLIKAIEQLLWHQMNGREFTRFNLNLLNCLHAAGFTPSQSVRNEKCVFVLPGIILPCDSHTLQKLSPFNDRKFRKALLVKSDLTPLHHHKGYKSTLENKVIISTTSDKTLDSESAWTSSVFATVQKLEIDIIFVKGNVKEKLVDLFDSAGVLVFANLSFHTLNTLAFINNTEMVTYVTDASEEHVCDIELQPLFENWMDHLDDADTPRRHYLKIVNSSEVQTVVLNYSTSMSACIAEEKLWKSLNCLSNAVKDKKILPGGGRTEAWCAELLKQESASCLETNQGIEHVVLESLSQVFQNYSSLVQQNGFRNQGKTVGNVVFDSEHEILSSFMSQNEISDGSLTTKQNLLSPSLQHDGGIHVLKDRDGQLYRTPPQQHQAFKTSTHPHNSSDAAEICNFPLSNLTENVYDNFSSKLASWETAVDVVYLLSNLNSLVITGIDMTSSDREFTIF